MLLTYADCFNTLSVIRPKMNNFDVSNLGLEYLKLNRFIKNCEFEVNNFFKMRDELINSYIDEVCNNTELNESKETLDKELFKNAVMIGLQNQDLNKFIESNPSLIEYQSFLNTTLNDISTELNDKVLTEVEVATNFTNDELLNLFNNFKSVLSGAELLQVEFLFKDLI